jgi:hypothetical protein
MLRKNLGVDDFDPDYHTPGTGPFPPGKAMRFPVRPVIMIP